MKCTIRLCWDDGYWYSKSMDERFGMTLESGSLDVLIERVKMAVPDMFEELGYTGEIDLNFEIDRNIKLNSVAS